MIKLAAKQGRKRRPSSGQLEMHVPKPRICRLDFSRVDADAIKSSCRLHSTLVAHRGFAATSRAMPPHSRRIAG
jgi:hypothetical protein